MAAPVWTSRIRSGQGGADEEEAGFHVGERYGPDATEDPRPSATDSRRLRPEPARRSGRPVVSGVMGAEHEGDRWRDVVDEPDPNGLVEALGRGRGRLVLVTGERGMGRSRRAMAILDRARSVSDVVVVGHTGLIEGHLVDVDSGEGFWPGHALDPPGGVRDVLAEDGDGHLTARCTTPAASLVRGIARIRPHGPAARATAEAAADPPGPEELGLAMVAEAMRRPISAVLEDVPLAGSETHAFIEDLLTVVETVPLLLVVTAATGWSAQGPNAARWRGWIGRHGVVHLPVAPVGREELLAAVRQVSPGPIPKPELESILAASRGNPRLAQELAVWTLEGGSDGIPRGGLVRQLVSAHEEERILAAVAVAGMPVDVRLIGGMTAHSTTRVRQLLDRAMTAGVVARRSGADDEDTYVMAHPMYAAASCDLLTAEEVRALHRAAASLLITEHGDDPMMVADIARHLVASGHTRADTAPWCLRAASWCESTGQLQNAVEHAQAGLDADADRRTGGELARTLARCHRRLGRPGSAAGVLRRALRTAVGGSERAPIAVDLLELNLLPLPGGTVGPRVDELLEQTREECPPDRPDLHIRAAALTAASTLRQNPDGARRAAERAVRNAAVLGHESAQTHALAVYAQTLMAPDHLDELERVGDRLLQCPGLEGLPAAAAAALARAERGRLDFLVREYSWRESRQPDRPTREALTLLGAGMAVLEGRRSALTEALLQLADATSPVVAMQAALLPVLWTISTRGRIPVTGPDISALPGAATIRELEWLGRLAAGPTVPHPGEIELVRQRVGGPGQLDVPHPHGTGLVRLAAAAAFARAHRDRELSTWLVDRMEPFVDQFAIVWPFLPVGPVGWFLAGPLQVLGRTEAAAAALLAAQEASQRLGAVGWALRSGAERSMLLSSGRRAGVEDVVRSTVGPLKARRFPGVLAEIRCRLGAMSAAVPAAGEHPGVRTCAGHDAPGSGCAVTAGGPATGPQAVVTPADPRTAVASPGRQAAVAQPGGSSDPGIRLTPREADIMALAAVGCTNQEIAKRLYLSVATVERHCTNLYRRLGVRNRAQALGVLGPLASGAVAPGSDGGQAAAAGAGSAVGPGVGPGAGTGYGRGVTGGTGAGSGPGAQTRSGRGGR